MVSIERTAIFEASFAVARASLMAHAMKKVKNRDAAEDIVSRVALKAWRAWPRYQDDNFDGWVHRIMTNEIVSYYRQERRYMPGGLDPNYAHHPTSAATQDHSLECRDVARAFEKLPPAMKSALLMVLVDVTPDAKAMSKKVRHNLSKARKALREATA